MNKLLLVAVITFLSSSFTAQAHEVAGLEHYEEGDANHAVTYEKLEKDGISSVIFNLDQAYRARTTAETFDLNIFGHVVIHPSVKQYNTNVRGDARWIENISWETEVYVTKDLQPGEQPFHYHPNMSRNAVPADNVE